MGVAASGLLGYSTISNWPELMMFFEDPWGFLAGDDRLIYVFELTRHGARAPMLGSGEFSVAKEMLTPMGMRQRYLLGRYFYAKYGAEL